VFKSRSHLTYNVGSSLKINAGIFKIDTEFSELHRSVLSTFIECRNQVVLKLKLLLEVSDPSTNLIHFSFVYSFFEMGSKVCVAGLTCVGLRAV
jgi:hypothetical protein